MNLIEIEKEPLFEKSPSEENTRWYVLPYVQGAPMGTGKTLLEALEDAAPQMRYVGTTEKRAIKTADLGTLPELWEVMEAKKLDFATGFIFDVACKLAEKNYGLKRALREACRVERW